jgi:cob(I)alamin adenosyltransferase
MSIQEMERGKQLLQQGLQFLKYGSIQCGEEKILKNIKNIKFMKFNEESPVFNKKLNLKKLQSKSRKHIETAIKFINSGKYEVVILDELTYHFKYKTISVQNFIKKIKKRPYYVNIIITGRYSPTKLINIADTVTYMKKIKHQYDSGIKAIKGIDY